MFPIWILLELWSPRRPCLPTPSPEATPTTIQTFLTAFFVHAFACSQQMASHLARKFNGSGDELYAMSAKQFNALFTHNVPRRAVGRELYLELHFGRYGK
ncbi:MAG: hypothetical protein Q9215_008147, partial [Flavoplaca cf. flavocitrina]